MDFMLMYSFNRFLSVGFFGFFFFQHIDLLDADIKEVSDIMLRVSSLQMDLLGTSATHTESLYW